MTAYQEDESEYRELREKQAKVICDTISMDSGDWDMLALGMDMNDFPHSSVYDIFLNCGLVDVFNPNQRYKLSFNDVT